jgi:hypothetical protein
MQAHLDPQTLRIIAVVLMFFLIVGGRFLPGKAVETADGLAFPLKPLIQWTRLVLLPLYFGLFAWQFWRATGHISFTLAAFAVLIVALFVVRLPATITLTPTGITQVFFFFPEKKIAYSEVMSIQIITGGRYTRVSGDNRVFITHTQNHVDVERFRAEIAQRTGKKVIS